MSEEVKIPDNAEIDKALKDFEAKSQVEQAQKNPGNLEIIKNPKNEVEGVSFETENTEKYRAIKFYEEVVTPKMVKAVMKYSGGTVKDQKQAEWILLTFVVLAISISIYLVIGINISNPSQRDIPLGLPVVRKINNL